MSQVHFVEEQSSDAVERAIARKVVRILNDHSIRREQRMALVHKAQRELVSHRRRRAEQQALNRCAAAIQLPNGYRAVAVQVTRGQVAVAARKQGSLIWIDAGKAPAGVAADVPCRALAPAPRSSRRPAGDAIAERRLARQARRA